MGLPDRVVLPKQGPSVRRNEDWRLVAAALLGKLSILLKLLKLLKGNSSGSYNILSITPEVLLFSVVQF